MRKIFVIENLTLDGVMQAPGRPDEDTRGGFKHGGWALSYNDEVMMREMMGGGMGQTDLLFGRRTYEDFYGFWPKQTNPNPFTEVLNNTRKYVVSTTLTDSLPWANSTLLAGDGVAALTKLKQQPGNDLVILGSGVLVQSLMRHTLIDVYRLSIHPLVLGSGRHLFLHGDTAFTTLRLTHAVTTTTGVVIATYEPAKPTNPAGKGVSHV